MEHQKTPMKHKEHIGFHQPAVQLIESVIGDAPQVGEDCIRWGSVTLTKVGAQGHHITVDDAKLDPITVYILLGFCRYQGVAHSITSGEISSD